MIELKDLGMAYRKAKVDLYYSSHASLDAIADYEENLHANLLALQARINGEDESWVMAQCSLDFHVLSTLWILEVGHLFDAKLTNSAKGTGGATDD